MKTTENFSSAEDSKGDVLIEFQADRKLFSEVAVSDYVAQLAKSLNINYDKTFDPISLSLQDQQEDPNAKNNDGKSYFVFRATIDDKNIESIRNHRDILGIWSDAQIGPTYFCPSSHDSSSIGELSGLPSILGTSRLRDLGYDGTGVVVGVVDGGILAEGQPTLPSTFGISVRIPRVIGGWPNDSSPGAPEINYWGTVSEWNHHANMIATDILGIAPNCTLLDLRIASGRSFNPGVLSEINRDFVNPRFGRISNAIQVYRWSIDQYLRNGTPQILTNSWCVYQQAWAPDYARNIDHPFSQIVREAIRAGITVLFCAGNCGELCSPADRRCGSDIGPGMSIWGANALQEVITIGAVTYRGEYVGYSSQGPANLIDRDGSPISVNKPDLCSITAFRGYFPHREPSRDGVAVDSGTSAATAIAAGVVALLKQAYPNTRQREIKEALINSARQEDGTIGWNPNTGYGNLRGLEAFNRLAITTTGG